MITKPTIKQKKEKPVKQADNRNPDGTFKEGESGNPLGRPKGQSLKEYDRETFSKMTPKQKSKFLSKLNAIDRYKMAEGNPSNDVQVGATDELKDFLIKWNKILDEKD